jgi:hypothetical protein
MEPYLLADCQLKQIKQDQVLKMARKSKKVLFP